MLGTIEQKLEKLCKIYKKSSTDNIIIHTLVDQLSQVLTLCNPRCRSIQAVSDALTKISTLQQTQTDANKKLLGERLTSAIQDILSVLKTQQIRWLQQIKKYLIELSSSPLHNLALQIYNFVDLHRIIKDPKQVIKKQLEKPIKLREISRVLHDQSHDNEAKASSLSTLLSIDGLRNEDAIKAKILKYIQQSVEPPPPVDLIVRIDRVLSILEKSKLLSFSTPSIREIVRIMPQLQNIHDVLHQLAQHKPIYKRGNIPFPVNLYILKIKTLQQLLEQYLPVLYEISDILEKSTEEWTEWKDNLRKQLIELQETPPEKYDDVRALLSHIYTIFKKKSKDPSSQSQVYSLLETIQGLFLYLIQGIPPTDNVGIHPPFYYYLLLDQESWWFTEDAKEQVKKKLKESLDLLLQWIEDPSSIPSPTNDDASSSLQYLPMVLLVVLCL
jgi:hypothetical protein